jgi:hypothetical protein
MARLHFLFKTSARVELFFFYGHGFFLMKVIRARINVCDELLGRVKTGRH